MTKTRVGPQTREFGCGKARFPHRIPVLLPSINALAWTTRRWGVVEGLTSPQTIPNQSVAVDSHFLTPKNMFSLVPLLK